MSSPEYVSVAAAAERVDIDERTVRRWIEKGKLPAYRIGPGKRRLVRIATADLEALIEPYEPAGA